MIVAEWFYSLQGEGPTIGVPSVFLRMGGCLLKCTFCDTIDVWTRGRKVDANELLTQWENCGYFEFFKKGCHLVLTGGEPLVQSKFLVPFFERLYRRLGFTPYTEVETAGTVMPNELIRWVEQWNVSPKLSNSGEPEHKRICPDVLMRLTELNSFFKFVVSSRKDVEEAIDFFVRPYKILNRRTFLMPLSSSREEIRRMRQEVVELCKEYGFCYSDRLHLDVWDKRTGV